MTTYTHLSFSLVIKARRSTDMSTMVLKDTIEYYINNGSPVYCSFLDASKAFDRIEYCKLFRMLMKRQLPSVVLRFLVNMHVCQELCSH